MEPGLLLDGRYRVDERIAGGGMGTVFRGVDVHTDATVAIKVVRPSSASPMELLQRFLKEARLAAAVTHPAIVRMLHVDIHEDGVLYQVQDYVEGCTLEAALRDHGSLPDVAPALLAVLSKPNQSDPIHRGLFVRQRLLCQNLPPPPDDIVVVAPDPAPGLSTRERFREHSTNTRCQGCHQLMDPIGFGFEHYDALGRWRDADDGRPIDATGEVFATEDADGPFDGIPDLAAQLAGSQQVRECVARQAYRYAMQRTETSRDACSVAQVQEDFRTSGYDLRELFVAIVRTEGFRSMQVAR